MIGNKKAHLNHLIEDAERELLSLDAKRTRLIQQISSMKRQLETLEGEPKGGVEALVRSTRVTSLSPPNDKIALFRSLFRGREDVFPKRFESAKTGRSGYQPTCKNEWIAGICRKPRVKCSDCGHRELIPVSDEVISYHLRGAVPSRPHKEFCVGVYPMLPDETCWLLAADFDKASWADDCTAFLRTCKKFGVPAALERSRSGRGGHIWIFFAETVPAIAARRMGTFLLTETMEQRPEIGLDSYDRFFPSQDTLPQGGFGSLIALAPSGTTPPKQKQCIPGRRLVTLYRPVGISRFCPTNESERS